MRQPIQKGTRIGPYELDKRLNAGGMAEVWLGHIDGPGGFRKTTVIKTILPSFVHNPEFVRMFVNEARLAAMLNHQNIVQINDFIVVDGIPFIAMEHIDGRSLREVQARLHQVNAAMPRRLALRAVISLCDALSYAHNLRGDDGQNLGLVHRDVSPNNVMISYTGVVKVVDFGIAKAFAAPSITQVRTIKGKHPYLAPELLGLAGTAFADQRSDIYAVGVILYELLTGRRPFDAEGEKLFAMIKDQEPAPPCTIDRGIPPVLNDIVLKAMAKDPGARFQDAADLAGQLEKHMTSVRTHPQERDLARFMCNLFDRNQPREPQAGPEDPTRPDVRVVGEPPERIERGAPGSIGPTTPEDPVHGAPTALTQPLRGTAQPAPTPGGAEAGAVPVEPVDAATSCGIDEKVTEPKPAPGVLVSPAVHPEPRSEPAPPKPTPPGRTYLVGALVVLALLALGTGGYLATSWPAPHASADQPALATQVIEEAATDRDLAPRPADEGGMAPLVEVHLKGLPRAAVVRLDGEPVNGDLIHGAAGHRARLEVLAEGYQTLSQEVEFDPQRTEIDLGSRLRRSSTGPDSRGNSGVNVAPPAPPSSGLPAPGHLSGRRRENPLNSIDD
jgi:serine/threonine-protein kinase